MTATSTHDTKRSEDVRARIALLSEIPDEWRTTVTRWTAMNASKWGSAQPDRTMEHLLYQTMFGAPHLSVARVRKYTEKAVREAKLTSSWLHPSEHEASLFSFAEALVTDAAFQTDLGVFVDRFRGAARIASLGQLVLKATMPGVPDFYQGSELWTSSLVDPDNREDIDFAERIRLLDAIDAAGDDVDEMDEMDDGSLKLWMTRRLLQIRRGVLDAFIGPDATYAPIELVGDRARQAIAFGRAERVIVVAPIRPVAIDRAGWGDTAIALPEGVWTDALGAATGTFGDIVPISAIAHHGCSVLVRTGADG
jgi:(1->4)-alpha-D-glucan 1-alpha-D-glucosylmutase